MHVRLYRQLRLRRSQRDRFIAHWNLWLRRRRDLGSCFDDARKIMAALPQTLTVPAAFLARLAAPRACSTQQTASCMHARNACCANSLRGCCRCAGAQCADAGHQRAGCGEGSAGETAMHAGEWAAAGAFLGASACQAAAAAEGLTLLRAAHAADAAMHADTMDEQLPPGLLLTAPQVAVVWSAHLSHGCAPVDVMALCQLAVAQQRREDVAGAPRRMHELRGGGQVCGHADAAMPVSL